jgi:hypothetical protein
MVVSGEGWAGLAMPAVPKTRTTTRMKNGMRTRFFR